MTSQNERDSPRAAGPEKSLKTSSIKPFGRWRWRRRRRPSSRLKLSMTFSSFWFCSWAAGVYVLYKKRFSFFPLSFTVPLGANSLILVPHSCSAVPLLVFFWTFGFAFFFPPIATRPLRRVGGSRETAERSLTVRIYI